MADLKAGDEVLYLRNGMVGRGTIVRVCKFHVFVWVANFKKYGVAIKMGKRCLLRRA